MHKHISRLEKVFLLSLVQNAKCYHITRQENLEFLGEFAGGAKITRISVVKSKKYRSNTGRFERYVSSLTNKQTNKQTKKWRGGESKKLKFCKKNRSGALSFDSNLKEKKRD